MPLTEEERKERKRAYNKKYQEDNKEQILASRKIYYQDNKKECRQRSKKFREANIEAVCKREKLYRAANKEKAAKYAKAYYKPNKDKFLASMEKNKEAIKARNRILSEYAVLSLSDRYIKANITQSSDVLKFKDIPQSLIEAKRLELQMKRFIKEQENG
jgi:hypothetical protein